MKVTMICDAALPAQFGGGPRQNQWAVLAELRRRGHTVQIIYVFYRVVETAEREIKSLQSDGIPVTIVSGDQAGIGQAAQAIAQFQPGAIFSLGPYALLWARGAPQSIPRVCFCGEPPHLIESMRRQYDHRSIPMAYGEMATLHQRAIGVKDTYLPVLQHCAAVMCGSIQSVEWYRSQGVKCEYVSNPVIDPMPAGWRRGIDDWPRNPKPRILLVGHLQGIATLSGLYFLAEDVLPHLDVDDYEWRVCGRESLAVDLATRLKPYPQIKFVGYVDDIVKEFLAADIFLCPTPETIGSRTRIQDAFGCGSCVVAHSANAVGQPELVNGENIMLGSTGAQIAELIFRSTDDMVSRCELGAAARETFEKEFCVSQSAGKIVDAMERVCR